MASGFWNVNLTVSVVLKQIWIRKNIALSLLFFSSLFFLTAIFYFSSSCYRYFYFYSSWQGLALAWGVKFSIRFNHIWRHLASWMGIMSRPRIQDDPHFFSLISMQKTPSYIRANTVNCFCFLIIQFNSIQFIFV